MRLAVASDHAGYEMKQYLCRVLVQEGVQFEDLGPATADPVDYPDYAAAVAVGMVGGRFNAGLLVCGSGQGMVIAANRYPHVRATLCWTPEQAAMVRRHNDSNLLVLAGRSTGKPTARRILAEWLDTEFEGGRHERRLCKIDEGGTRPARRVARRSSR
ncbi:MAG: RpiB/LacA/LacB family sugar-phosphate isomerase [Candidatus Riflebacteria bacterium]|nr:RpiB/LacA/LacB family sugar-phosphate isomerase [Candidatus Riflebacteria bacterium]